jgi:uncharacterized protein YbjQ (UPF0145 family)
LKSSQKREWALITEGNYDIQEVKKMGWVFFFCFILLFGLIILANVCCEQKAKQKTAKIEGSLNDLRKDILVVTSGSIPGKNIKRIFGNVTGISNTQAKNREQFTLAEREAMHNLMLEAQKLGANAIIDLKLSTGTYQIAGSQQVSQSVYNGTAVQI